MPYGIVTRTIVAVALALGIAACGGGEAPTSSALTAVGEVDALPTADGDVAIVLVGPPMDNIVGFVAHNGTDETISGLDVSGPVVDADGQQVSTASSRLVEPSIIEPGGYAVGFVIADGDRLPADATLRDPTIDYAIGLRDGEQRTVGLQPQDLETTSAGTVVGDLANPHGTPVAGPLSVTAACISVDGDLLGTPFAYLDRDEVRPGESASFTLSSVALDARDCATLLVGGSGFTNP